MRGKWLLVTVLLLGLMLGAVAGLSLAQETESEAGSNAAPQALVGVASTPLSTGFTYQGRLDKGGSPYNGTCDFRFSLHDALSGGNPVGSTQTIPGVAVADGLFTVALNSGNEFGPGAFTGEGRWLAIEVMCAGDGSYTPLDPRQALTAAPYALALPGLWTQQNMTSTNVIGGYGGNSVAAGVVGATIGGGGRSGYPNQVTADYAAVGGGAGNTADGWYATVGGGSDNTAFNRATVGGGEGNTASYYFATVGGGWSNAASATAATVGGGEGNTASGYRATVGGGYDNTASGWYATVGGGEGNTASGYRATLGGGEGNTASGYGATVPGGVYNDAAGRQSFASGTQAVAWHVGTFVWADCGDHCLDPQNTTPFISTGENQFLIRAAGGVGIGTNNPKGAMHLLTAGEPPTGLDAENNGLLLGIESTGGYKWIQSYGGPLAVNLMGNNVGIGTATPGYKLDVAGSAHASSFPTSSDERLKTNVVQLAGSLDKLEAIRGVAFDWNKVYEALGRSTGRREIGVLAQEVETVFPELVTSWEEEGYKAVDYGRLAAVLVEAVKELRVEKEGQIASLEAENRSLREELVGLEARLVALEGASGASAPLGSGPAAPWWLVGGLVVAAGLVIQRRWPGGGG